MNKTTILMMAALAVGSAGCVGTSALRISTVPAGAKLYANGKYVGETPKDIPVTWGYYVLYSRCDATQIKIEKEGFKPYQSDITESTLGRRNRNGAYLPDSPFGPGRTYPYVINLQPVK